MDLTDTAARVRGATPEPVELAPTPEPFAAEGEETGRAAAEAVAEPGRRPAARKRGRASVPSWDEIMFGGGKAE